jgi:hypothetical protein
MFFGIRRRSTGKIVESGFMAREIGKPLRNALNKAYYGKKDVPTSNAEYYIVRTENHYRGSSK